MITTEINYKGENYTCRIVKDSDGEELIIAGTSLLDELMPYEITDVCNGFADKEAEEVDEEIFYYTNDSDLKLPDAAHRTICRSKDCEASVTKLHFGCNPQLIYFQKSHLRPFTGLLLCGYKINDFQREKQIDSTNITARMLLI